MFTTIRNSIFKPSSYKQMTQKPLWRLVLTLIGFQAVVIAVQAYMIAMVMNPFFTFMEKEFPTKMPSFRFDGKELQVNAPTPFILSDQNGYRVIVDVSSSFPSDTINRVSSGVVIGKTEVYVIERGVRHPIPYNQLLLPPLDKADAVAVTPYLRPLFAVGMAVWSLLLLAWAFIQITVFSFISSLLASVRRIRLTFKEVWLVAAFAFIPASMIDLLNFYMHSPYLRLAFWVAILTYIYHGVGSFKGRSDLD